MKLKTYAVLITIAFLLVACSSLHVPSDKENPPTGAKQDARVFSYIPGFYGHTVAKTHALNLSLVPEAHAQVTTTVAMTGNYNGFCGQVYSQSGPYVVYGLGSYVNAQGDCTDTLENMSKEAGQLVLGNGTLKNFVVAVEKGSGTGKVDIYVNGISKLSIPIQGSPNSAVRVVDTASTIPVLDGDYVAAVADFTAASTPAYKLRVFIGKE